MNSWWIWLRKNTFDIKPIGFVRIDKNDTIEGKKYIEVLPSYLPGLFKLDSISHAFILWWIHESDNPTLRVTKNDVIPRVRNNVTSAEKMGTFATRSPHRPNPIGLTLVKIMKIENNKILIDKIDAFEGSPVIDIKPYLPNGDRVDKELYLPPWFQHLLESRSPDLSNEWYNEKYQENTQLIITEKSIYFI